MREWWRLAVVVLKAWWRTSRPIDGATPGHSTVERLKALPDVRRGPWLVVNVKAED